MRSALLVSLACLLSFSAGAMATLHSLGAWPDLHWHSSEVTRPKLQIPVPGVGVIVLQDPTREIIVIDPEQSVLEEVEGDAEPQHNIRPRRNGGNR